MLTLFKILLRKLHNLTISAVEEFMYEKYKGTSIPCFVWKEHKDLVTFKIGDIVGTVEDNDKMDLLLRKQAGQYVLTTRGLPRPDEEATSIHLIICPSFFKVGFKKIVKLARSWPGDSKIGSLIVVKYKAQVFN